MRHVLLALVILTSCVGPSASLSDTTRPIAPVPDAGTPLAAILQTHVDRFVGDGSVSFVLSGPNEQEPQLPAVIIGVVSRGFRGVVTRSRPGAPLLAGGTILPLSSISKAITGILAARDAVEGRFDETTPASKLLGPDLAGLLRDRTVGELVTHTAGYAVNPRNLACGEQAGYSSMLMWSSTQGVGVIVFSTVGRSSKTLAGLGLEVLLAVLDTP